MVGSNTSSRAKLAANWALSSTIVMVRSLPGLGSPGQSSRARVPKKGISSSRDNHGMAVNPGIVINPRMVILVPLPQAASSRR